MEYYLVKKSLTIVCTGHDKSADIWSYGVLIYEMLVGANPFYDESMDQMDLFKAIVRGKWNIPDECDVSLGARYLLEQILVVDPKNRLGCGSRADLDIREHQWFQGVDFGALYRKNVSPPWKPTVGDPFDDSNFGDWSNLENQTKVLRPLDREEQRLFKDFAISPAEF